MERCFAALRCCRRLIKLTTVLERHTLEVWIMNELLSLLDQFTQLHCFCRFFFSDYLEKEHLFRLKFRGLTFEFKIDPRLEARRFMPIFLIYCWVLIDIVLVNGIFVYGCSLSTNTAWVPCSSQTDLHQLYRACFSTPEIRTKISSQCLTHTIRL